ncbi:hypothetical protein [Bradyrhizobium sp. S3.9.1]|uniref:hypothetical protein n=1 Tax=Bradyrhizobium sp. S3.9.1 TaxID=3156431 RepID=UPI003393FA8A
MTTASNSRPFALCNVVKVTRPAPSTGPANRLSGMSRSFAGSVFEIISEQTSQSCSELRAIACHGSINSRWYR